MGENLDDDRGIFNGRNEGQGAAALRTCGDVDGKHAFEYLGPTHAGPRGRREGLARPIGGVWRLVGYTGYDLGPQGRIGCEYAMEANEMEPGPRDERGQALQEFQRGHDEISGAIAVDLANEMEGIADLRNGFTESDFSEVGTERSC